MEHTIIPVLGNGGEMRPPREEVMAMFGMLARRPEINGSHLITIQAANRPSAPVEYGEDEKTIETLKTSISSTKSKVYQLLGFYNVFSGVILTAVVTSNRLQCQHLWSPTGLCAVAFLMMMLSLLEKFQKVRRLEREIEKLHKLRCFIPREPPLTSHLLLLEKPLSALSFTILLAIFLAIFTAGLIISFIHVLCWS